MLLLSQDYGKHLLGVEDLMQKHALVEADIGIQADRVKAVNNNAQKFAVDEEGKTQMHFASYTLVYLGVFQDRHMRTKHANLACEDHSYEAV